MKNEDNKLNRKDKSRNPDPITGAPGSHPVGTGLGAAAGGAATGAAVGTFAGPVGTLAGAAVGAVVGGLVGKGIAEKVDPTIEDSYWRENHPRQAWGHKRSYDDFSPAYRAGYEGYGEFGATGRTFEESEVELRRRYEINQPALSWDEARPATEAAWRRFDKNRPSDAHVDTYGDPKRKS